MLRTERSDAMRDRYALVFDSLLRSATLIADGAPNARFARGPRLAYELPPRIASIPTVVTL